MLLLVLLKFTQLKRKNRTQHNSSIAETIESSSLRLSRDPAVNQTQQQQHIREPKHQQQSSA
jgi:hypothetical protein